MKNIIRCGVMAAALTIASSGFARVSPTDLYGESYEPSNIYQRTVTIGPNTKSVAVSEGEMIRFVDRSTGKSFVWKVGAVAPGDGGYRFDLMTVAPPGTLSGHVMAYVGPDLRDAD